MGLRVVLLAAMIVTAPAFARAEPIEDPGRARASTPDVVAPPTRDENDSDETLPPPPPAPPPVPEPSHRVVPPPDWTEEPASSPVVDEPVHEPRVQRRWYGYQTLLTDLGSVVLMGASASERSSDGTLLGVGIAGYFLGAPVVHLFHGHADKAAGSLGLRALGPLLIAGAFASSDGASSRDGSVGLAVLGVLLIPAAVIIDAAGIAREDVPRRAGVAGVSGLRIAPFLPRRGSGAGLGATFVW